MNKTDKMDTLARLFYFIAIILVGVGFFKMYVYEKGAFSDDSVNAYVGGDAFNYIINAIYAGDYFILAFLCVFAGFAIHIYALLKYKIELENERQTKQGE